MPWPDNPLAATYHSALRGLQGRFDQAPGRRLCSPGHPASSQRRRSRTVWCRARCPDRTGRRFRREVGGHRPGPPARERDAVGGRKSWSGPGSVAGLLGLRPTGSRRRLVARLFRCAGVSGLSGAPCTIRTCDLQIRSSHPRGDRPPPGCTKHNKGRGISRGERRELAPLLCLVGPG